MRSFKSFKFLNGEVLRFLVAGGANTAATYGIYLLVLQLLPYRVAYTIAYALGIVLAYALNTWFVFRSAWDWKKLLAYPLVYLLQYGLGMLCLTVLVEQAGVNAKFAPLVVVAITLPVSFFASRFLIKRPSL